MKTNKKVLVGLGIAGGLLLARGIVHAGGLEEELLKYLNDDRLDLLGRKFEDILFRYIKQASNPSYWNDAELKAKLRFIVEDIKTLPLQAKCIWKIINQEANAIIYGLLSGNAYLKVCLGEKVYKNMIFKLLKILFRGH